MDIGSIDSGNVIVRVLSTNTTSMTVLTDEKFNGKVIQPEVKANRVTAEHGLAMSIEVKDGDEKHVYLLDGGGLMGTILENSKQLGVNLKEVEKVILSHGHFDHFGGLMSLIPELKEGCELLINPYCFRQNQVVITTSGEVIPADELGDSLRQLKKEKKIKMDKKLPVLNKALITKLTSENGVKLVEITEPVKLHEGIVTSGEIELFDESEITKGFYLPKSRKEFEKHTFRDETSIYINVKDNGLTVITGCGHTGIMNTIKHGQKLSGIEKVYAVIGGFHEEWNPTELIEKKVKFIEGLNPAITCGMHCTGFEFNKLMSRHPSHTLGIVGTEFHL